VSSRPEARGSILRVVFDTNTVVSALLFATGRLAWLRQHWRTGGSVPLISRATAVELTRLLGYPKFRLSPEDRVELLGDYLPGCATVERVERCAVECRDPHDQMFLDLSGSGKADVLVTGDRDLLVLAGKTLFSIETPEEYRQRMRGTETEP
jgi:uncharacterized protein